MARLDRIQRQIDLLEREAMRLATLPDLSEVEEDGAVIFFRKRFPNSTVNYAYVAVCFQDVDKRGILMWATTGPRAPKYYTTEEMQDWLSEGVEEIWFATEWEQL